MSTTQAPKAAELPAESPQLEGPAFIDDIGPAEAIPTHFTLANTRELFGLQPGEQLADAMKRRGAGQGK